MNNQKPKLTTYNFVIRSSSSITITRGEFILDNTFCKGYLLSGVGIFNVGYVFVSEDQKDRIEPYINLSKRKLDEKLTEKECILIFDGVKIKQGFSFDGTYGRILGPVHVFQWRSLITINDSPLMMECITERHKIYRPTPCLPSKYENGKDYLSSTYSLVAGHSAKETMLLDISSADRLTKLAHPIHLKGKSYCLYEISTLQGPVYIVSTTAQAFDDFKRELDEKCQMASRLDSKLSIWGFSKLDLGPNDFCILLPSDISEICFSIFKHMDKFHQSHFGDHRSPTVSKILNTLKLSAGTTLLQSLQTQGSASKVVVHYVHYHPSASKQNHPGFKLNPHGQPGYPQPRPSRRPVLSTSASPFNFPEAVASLRDEDDWRQAEEYFKLDSNN